MPKLHSSFYHYHLPSRVFEEIRTYDLVFHQYRVSNVCRPKQLKINFLVSLRVVFRIVMDVMVI